MSSIDERIVKMSFDNTNFESRISKTLESLEKLNQVLSKTGNATSMNELSKAIKAVNTQLSALNIDEINKIADKQSAWQKIGSTLSGLGKGIGSAFEKLDVGGKISKITSAFSKATDGSNGLNKSVEVVSNGFSALGVIGATALANITNSAVNTSKRLLNSFTLEPVTTGFSEYETKMNAISTILANTADDGETLETVSAALNELNVYADDTIYNFAQMTENIGRFTAAGVGLKDSVASIKGLANLAAFFGVDPVKASSAMYQMSQAIAAGKIQLMDWNSLVNAGMSGEAFQEALIRTSEVMGTGADAAIKKYGSFRESLTKGAWLTSDVMVETLKQISGAYKESELRAKGYSATQAKAIVDMAKQANKSATEVRTITGMIDAMKESVQSGWAISWEHIIGDKEQATELLTGVKDAFESIITPATEARNKMLEFWNQNGGRDAVIKGLSNTFQSLGKVMSSIGDAWKEVFPSMTGPKLVELSEKFKDFTGKLKVSDETADKIKSTFKGVFDVFKTVGSAVGSVLKGLSPLTGVFSTIGKIVLTVTSGIGKFASAISDAVDKSKVFDKISSGLQNAIKGIGNVFNSISDAVSTFFNYLGNLDFSKAFGFIGKGFSAIGDILKPVFDALGKALGTIDFNTITKAMQTGTFLNVLKTLKDTFKEVSDIGESAKGVFNSFKGIGKSVKETLNAVKESLVAWQNDLQAKTILKIAGAIGILAGALLILATIDGKKLATGLAGMAAIFGELTLAYIAMFKFTKGGSLFDGVSGKLYAMSISILILAAALKILSTIEVGEMMTGLVGLFALLGAMVASLKLFDKEANNLKKTASALIVFGIAMGVMAGALKLLGSIDSETLGGGLFALFGVLTELALFLRASKFDGMSAATGLGVLGLATAMVVLAGAMQLFGSMDPRTIITGLAGIAGVMSEIIVFSELADFGDMAKLAAGLVLMSGAMIALTLAMKSLGSMEWETIAKGLVSMGGALTIFSLAAKSMKELELATLAVGLGLMGGAMMIVASAIQMLGSMSLEQLATGLLGMASALLIMGVAMAAISGIDALVDAAAIVVMAAGLAILVPQIVALAQLDIQQVGVALVALSGALLLIGIAGALITPALPGLLGLAGAAALLGAGCALAGIGITAMGTGLTLIAGVIGGSGFLIVEFLRQLINLLPQIGLKAGEAMVNFAGAIANGAPQIISAFSTLLQAILTAIQQNIPLIAQTGVDIIVAFAQALATGIPQLVTAGCEMILGVLQGIANNIGPIVEAGADICINFMDGVAAKLPEIIDSGINLALSFIEGVAEGISNNSDRLEAAIEKVIQAMVDAGLAILQGSIDGFVSSGEDLVNGLIDGIVSLVTGVAEASGRLVDSAIDGLGDCGTALYSAGENLVKGFCNGITSALSWVGDKAREIATKAKNAAEKALGINSPSRVFMEIGRYTTEGFAVGLDKYSRNATKSATNLANSVIDNVKNPLSNLGNIINGEIDANPTITPVLDLSNVERNSRRLGDLVSGNGTLSLSTDNASLMTKSIGQIQNGKDNSDIVSALKDLKDNLGNNGPSYTINGITYDDGSNIVNAVETLVRAAKIERRI